MNAPATARVESLESGTAALSKPTTPAQAPPIRAAVLGASGYAGQEFVRLALAHPGVTLAAIGTRDAGGALAASMWAGLGASSVAALPAAVSPEAIPALLESGAADTLVSCLPHGALRALRATHPALDAARWIVDLSSDHRDGRDGYVYGLPEQSRVAIAGATRVANPGCYATAAALALLPAAGTGWLAGPVTISALSGVTGAGRAPELRTSFAELDGNAALYKVGEVHAHLAEMTRALAAAGAATSIAFAPMLAPMARGILLTAWAPLAAPLAPEAAQAAYEARFAGEPFVRVLAAGAWPETRAVRGSNRCDLAVTTVHGGRTLLASAAIDNLVKGAAGQALQNLNLMTGWPETTGLPVDGRPW